MNVLSLFDGMSCGQIALNKASIPYNVYFASEIKPHAIKVTQHNYPDTMQINDVTKVSGKVLPKIDLLIGGSPCQNLSIAMALQHRKGLEGDKSGLFYEYYRLLKETNPKYFFLENVGSMRKADQEVITELLGVKPVRINSKVASPQLRNRLYWTNIPWEVEDLNSLEAENLNDILDEGWSDREKARCLLESDSRPLATPLKMFHRYYAKGFTTLIFKDEAHYEACKSHYDCHYKGLSAKQIDDQISGIPIDNSVYDGVRYLNQRELERCQTVSEGYTECVSRDEAASLLGDGWTVDVIARFFKNLK